MLRQRVVQINCVDPVFFFYGVQKEEDGKVFNWKVVKNDQVALKQLFEAHESVETIGKNVYGPWLDEFYPLTYIQYFTSNLILALS